jgi:putative Holliday junction resolvase
MGRVLAVDLGTRRVGLAITDPLRMVASPLEMIPYRSRADLVERLVKLVRDRQVATVVIGLPVGVDGSEGEGCRRSRNLARDLETRGIEVSLQDERYSSREAEQALRDMGVSAMRSRGRVDPVAAAVILREFLDERGRAGEG